MKKPKYIFIIYKDKKGEYRYKLMHRNGKEILKSSEGYSRKATMLKIWGNIAIAFCICENISYQDKTVKK